MLAFGITILLLVLLILRMPVAVALSVSGVVGLYLIGGTRIATGLIETTVLSSVSSYELLTIPLFLLMAEFVVRSGIADELFESIVAWVGRAPAGLGISTALAGAGFGAISGSSTAAAATLSATTIPAMLKQGYEPKLATGIVAISGTLSMLIPPSIALVIYAIIADVSIGKLLIAGIIPGLLVAATIIATTLFLVWRNPESAPIGRAYSIKEKLYSLRVAGPMVALFGAVMGTIYLGLATVTEAAGIGAFGAFLLALLRRRLTTVGIMECAVNAARTSLMIMFIIIGGHLFGYFITLTQTTQSIVSWFQVNEVSPFAFLTFALVFYLILGCFMDQIAIQVLTVPIMLPLVISIGYDPIWFGVFVVLMAEVGLVTPPLGLNVFVVSKYTGRSLQEVFTGVAPHVATHLILVIILTVFPWLVLWLPSNM